MNPVASVIIPCYNVERYVESALGSVLSQTFPDFEVIAVDDGSSDGTGAILARLAAADARIKVLSQANRGVSAARNRGMDAACGKYLFFADPDDRTHPEMLAKGVAEMERSGADMCIFAYRRKIGDDAPWQTMSLKGDYRYATNKTILQGFFPRMFGYSNEQARIWGRRGDWCGHREEGGVWRCVYRRELIERARVRFDETIVLYEDAMFNCEYLLSAQSMTCLDIPLYDYILRQHGAIGRNNRSLALFINKRRLLDKRKELDRRSGGCLTAAYSASCVFSVLEMLHALFTTDVKLRDGLREILAYLRDPVVRLAFRTFPLAIRRPIASATVIAIRLILLCGVKPS